MIAEEIVCPNCDELTLVNLPAARESYGCSTSCSCACRYCRKVIYYDVRQEIGSDGVIDGVPRPQDQ